MRSAAGFTREDEDNGGGGGSSVTVALLPVSARIIVP